MPETKEHSDYVHARVAASYIGVLEIDHPPYNILDFAILNTLREKFAWLQGEEAVKAIVIKTNSSVKPGVKLFSTGANVKEIGALSLSGDRDKGEQAMAEMHKFFLALSRSPKPTIAAIDGLCLGGGLELVLACQYRVASEDASFGLPEVSHGFIPGLGGTQRLPRLVGRRAALKMILDANEHPVDAAQALAMHLVNEVAEGDFNAWIVAFVERVLADALPKVKQVIDPRLSAEDFKKGSMLHEAGMGKPTAAVDAAIQAVNEGMEADSLEEALQFEQKLFFDLLFSWAVRGKFARMQLKKSWKNLWKKMGGVFHKKPSAKV